MAIAEMAPIPRVDPGVSAAGLISPAWSISTSVETEIEIETVVEVVEGGSVGEPLGGRDAEWVEWVEPVSGLFRGGRVLEGINVAPETGPWLLAVD